MKASAINTLMEPCMWAPIRPRLITRSISEWTQPSLQSLLKVRKIRIWRAGSFWATPRSRTEKMLQKILWNLPARAKSAMKTSTKFTSTRPIPISELWSISTQMINWLMPLKRSSKKALLMTIINRAHPIWVSGLAALLRLSSTNLHKTFLETKSLIKSTRPTLELNSSP